METSVQRQFGYSWASPPTRQAGLSRLRSFLPRVGAYAQGRNFDRQEEQAVSQLSPFIRYRLLREREVIEEVLERYRYSTVEKFINQVSWRTYFKGYLEQHSEIWEQYTKCVTGLGDDLGEFDEERLSRAREGRTGIECFDVWVEQLVQTGWLHNHVRMWFASIWIFTLKLPWQLGAAFFMEHLIDGDPASNTLSWRWTGGLHTRGKHYLARAANISRYTIDRFNPKGQLNESAECLPWDGPIMKKTLSPPASLREVEYPSLSVSPVGLLVTPEDLTPEYGELAETPFSSICAFSAKDRMDAIQASTKVRHFVDGAIEDTGNRLAHHWDGTKLECEREVIPFVGKASPLNVGRRERMRIYVGVVDTWEKAVLTWAKNENLRSVWLMEPPVGAWRDALPGLQASLAKHGISVSLYRRRWDQAHWPEAGSGYYRFRKTLRDRIWSIIS